MSNILAKTNIFFYKINLEKLEKFFFALFLISIPIQTRLIFITPQTYFHGTFKEYVTFFLYLSDILLITTLILFFVNTLTFTNFLSLIKKGIHSFPHLIPTSFLLITFITWSFASIAWSDHKNIAFYQSVKTLEFALLFLYARSRLQWFGFNYFASLIFISGFCESIIGIAQYYLQKSLGLRILMESVLSPDIPNVAKIVIDDERIIRAYGTFPHPNIFSGFLILSIFCGIWLLFSLKTSMIYKIVSPSDAPLKLFHVKQLPIYILIKLKKYIDNYALEGRRETILYTILVAGVAIQSIALILTFSRISWFTVILILVVFIFVLNRLKLFHVKQFTEFIFKKTTIVPILCVMIPILILIGSNWQQISSRANVGKNIYYQSINNRVLYNNIAINIIKEYPLTGIGGKNFTIRMQEFTKNPLESWQFQPAHNIYLLIASELGIIGLILFLSFLCLTIRSSYSNIKSKIVSRAPAEATAPKTTYKPTENKQIVSRETILEPDKLTRPLFLQIALLSVFIGFLFIGLFDHYFWTLQQGQLTFWILLGAIDSTKN